MPTLDNKDYIVFFLYFVIIVLYGTWIYRRKKKAQASSKDYFLAEGSLTWWAMHPRDTETHVLRRAGLSSTVPQLTEEHLHADLHHHRHRRGTDVCGVGHFRRDTV